MSIYNNAPPAYSNAFTPPHKILVKRVSPSPTLKTIDVTPDMTLSDAKKLMIKELGFLGDVRCIWRGKQLLPDTLTLTALGVSDGDTINVIAAMPMTTPVYSYTPKPVTDAELFESIRKINKFQWSSTEFRQSLLRALKLCREVILGNSQSEDVTVEAALNFLSEPMDGNTASLLHWVVEQYMEKECVGKLYGHLADKEKKTNSVLEIALESIRMIDFDMRQNNDVQYLAVLQRLLTPDLIWYAGKWEKMGQFTSFKEGSLEHLEQVRALVDELKTIDLVRNLLPESNVSARNDWQRTEFDVHIAVMRAKLKTTFGAEKEEIGAELKRLVQQNLDSRLEELESLRQAADQADVRSSAASDAFQLDESNSNKEAWAAAKKEAESCRKMANCIVASAGVCTLLADNKEAFDEDQFTQALQSVLQVLTQCTVTDATNLQWENEDVPAFTAVFDKLSKLAVSADDKQAAFMAQLHCVLQCWRTDRVPMHQFALKKLRKLGTEEVHRTRKVDGPGVGQIQHVCWDTDWKNRKKFEILEVISLEGELENPNSIKYTYVATYKIMYNMWKLKVQWVDTGIVETKVVPFYKHHSHMEELEGSAMSPKAFHAWIDQSKFFEELFGVRYNAFLLNSEGKAFIEYLAKHGQLASHHAACMLSKLASSRSMYERDEVKTLILTLMKDMEAAGQVSVLETVGSDLEPVDAAGLLLEKDDFWWGHAISDYSASMAFVQSCLSVLEKLPAPYDLVDPLNALCVEVMAYADNHRSTDQETEQGPPLRVEVVKQSVDRIAAVLTASGDAVDAALAASRASSGLLHKVLNRVMASPSEFNELLDILTHSCAEGQTIVSLCIQEMNTVAAAMDATDHIASRLGPRLALTKLLVNNGHMAQYLLVDDMQSLMSTFASLNQLEMLLEWFAQLTNALRMHPEQQQLTSMLFNQAAGRNALQSSQGFEGFKQLFLTQNAHTLEQRVMPEGAEAITKELGGCITSLDNMVGIEALWGMVLHGNQIVADLAQSLLLKIYFSLTLSVDHTHDELLNHIFNILRPDNAEGADSEIQEISVSSFNDSQKYGTKCHLRSGGKKTVWHSTAQWEAFLGELCAADGIDFSADPKAVCDALDEKAKQLLSSKYADIEQFTNSGDGELSRKPSAEVVAECDKAQVTLRLLEALLVAVNVTSAEQKLSGHRFSSRGEPLSVDVKGELWQRLQGKQNGHWHNMPSVTITTHTTATVANLKARALEAHSVPHADKMECVLSTGEGQPMKNSLSLHQAGFNAVNREAVVKIFPAMHIKGNVLSGVEKMSLPSIGDAMTQSDKYYKIIFDVLASSSALASSNEQQQQVMEKAWHLLEVLPRSAVADQALEAPDNRDWDQDLSTEGDVNSMAAWQAVYNVQSINSKLRPAQVGDEPGLAEAGLQWRRAFLGNGGFSAVYKLLQELAGATRAHSVQLGLSPIVQVLEYCIEGANRASSDTESPVCSPNPAGLQRAFSSTSQQFVKQVDHDQLLDVLLQLITCDLYTDQRTHLIRALSAVVSSTQQLSDRLLGENNKLVQSLLVSESAVTCEATASLLMSMCSNFGGSEVLSAVLDVTTAAMIEATSTGQAENCQFALGLLLDVVRSNQEEQFEQQHATKMATLLKKSFAEMQTKGEQPSADWLKLLGCLVCKISPEVLDKLELTNFIWDQLYSGTMEDLDARAATVQALLQVARTETGLLEMTTRMTNLQSPTIESCNHDSTVSKSYWFVDPEETGSIRSGKGSYSGLNNQGNTCYQNSTLQQLFMQPQIREQILSAQVPDEPELHDLQASIVELKKTAASDPAAKEALGKAEAELLESKNLASRIALFKELQKVLASLKYGVTRSYNPRSFVDQAGKDQLFPFDVRTQQDASEFYSKLIERLEEAFKGVEGGFQVFQEQSYLKTQWMWEAQYNDAPVSRMGGPGEFIGILSQISLLDDTGMVVESLEKALALKLGKPEAMDGIQWDTLADQTADGKPPALNSTRTMLITHAPPTLCFMLNRFNPFTMEKLNDRFEFGHELDLSDYLTPEAKEEKQNGKYRLGGIVIQSGSAGGGHYYSFIRDRATGEWNRFDDSSVAPWNPDEEMEADCFGGTQEEKFTNAQGVTTFRTSGGWRTAYMLIYDRDDPELSEPVDMEMSEEVKASWGGLINENKDATAKALVCNLPHLQLLLELMNTNHKPPTELLHSMLAMAIPFFFSVVVRLGASKAPVYSYSSTTTGYSTYTGYGTGSTNTSVNKALEAEENEELDELLWQWGYMLGALVGQASEEDIAKLLEEHKTQLTGALFSCPRVNTRKSISRMLLRIASVGSAQALLVYKVLMEMLPLCSKTSPNDHLEEYSVTLRRMLQTKEVRAHARTHEGVARILNSLIMNSPLTFSDFSNISAADEGADCKKPYGSHSGLASHAPELCDAVCELLGPVDELPEVSAKMIANASVLRDLQTHSSARGKVLLLGAGVVTGGEAAGRKVINDTITALTPLSSYSQSDLKKRTARDAIPALMTPEYGEILIEALVRKAVDLANQPASAAYQPYMQTKAKLANEVLELVLELSSDSIADNWLQNNRNVWEPLASQPTVHLTDPAHRAALRKLLHGEGAEDAGVENVEQALVSAVHEQLKAHGEYFLSKSHWCQKALQVLGPMCDASTAANWVMSHEVELSRADRADNGPIAGANAEQTTYLAVDAADLIDSWQKMVDEKLFAACEHGDSKMDELLQWIQWGADVDSTHISSRSCLHQAARNAEADAVKLLLDHGAYVNAETEGWTPLHNACEKHKSGSWPNLLPTIRNLLQGKADITAQITAVSWNGLTPLDICTRANKKDAEEILRRYV